MPEIRNPYEYGKIETATFRGPNFRASPARSGDGRERRTELWAIVKPERTPCFRHWNLEFRPCFGFPSFGFRVSDYPPGVADVTTVRVCDVPIVGRSVAGQESFYRLPTLRSALEVGRCPDALVAVPNVFVTHAHLDHAAGVASYASQRTLQGLEPGRVFLPAEVKEGFEKILALHVSLEGFERYAAVLHGVRPGDRFPLRHDLEVDVIAGSHRIPCAGYVFCEMRRKLRRDLAGSPGEEIARLRERGVAVTEEVRTPLLAYPGDCDAGIFDAAPEIFRARILLLECTFLRPGEEEKAARYGHLHLSDIAARAGDFANEAIVLTHFSAKYSKDEIEQRVRTLPASLRDRVTAFA